MLAPRPGMQCVDADQIGLPELETGLEYHSVRAEFLADGENYRHDWSYGGFT